MEMTKNDQTKAAYLARSALLIKRYELESGQAVSADYAKAVDWLVALKPDISRATWRQYKASFVWYLECRQQTELAAALKTVANDGCRAVKDQPVQQRHTSARKKKSISEREEALITQHLNESNSDSFWSKPTLALFRATLATGLRPVEWPTAQLLLAAETEDGKPTRLRVKNAKATNDRAHGEYRHLDLSELDEADLLFIRIALQYTNPNTAQGWLTPEGKAKNFNEYYNYLRAHLYRVTKKLFPVAGRRVSLYSCRHQFIANVKKAKYSKEEIAAMVGHATDETATVHYGRARYGRSRSGLPKPDASEVARIRQVYKGRPQVLVGETMER